MPADISPDLLVRVEVIAAAQGKGINTIRRAWLSGRFPVADQQERIGPRSAGLWRVSTIRRHDPALAARCLAVAQALESVLKAA